jgi:hypothetical protein
MDVEIDYYPGPQQALGDRSAFSKLYPSHDSSEMGYYGADSAVKYQDYSSAWAAPFVNESEDFLGWPGAFDGDTTEPASDDLDGSCQVASSSSDEDSERQAPWALGNTDHWKTFEHHGQRSSSQLQDRLSQAHLPLQACSHEDGDHHPSAPRRQLPEEGLIDVDPEEGRKQGGELLAMLFAPQEAPEATSNEASRWGLSADAPEFLPPKSTSTAMQPPQSRQQQTGWAAEWGGCGAAGWSSENSGAQSQQTQQIMDSSSRQAAAVQQAAHEAFGSVLKEVVVANDGYCIFLHEGCINIKEVPVLSILSRALWPLLGREVVALEPSAAPAGQPRLALKTHGDGSDKDSQCCWEFITTGACPRGSRCRWEHECPATTTTYIDVCVY